MRIDVVLVAIALSAVACQRQVEEVPTVAPKVVKCASVQAATVKDVIELRGTVAPLPDRDAQVAPQVSGRLLRVLVREGDPVSVGQVVARVDDAAFVDAADQATAVLARAKAELENAETTLARVQTVFEHGIVARQEVDDATTKVASAKAAQTEAQAGLREVRRQVDRATVRSPIQGVVLKVLKRVGELVDGTPATPVVEIADISELELVTDVPVQDLVRLGRGAPAIMTFSALPGREFKASVSRVAPSVDPGTGVGMVRIAIESSDSAQPPVGAFGVARVESGEPRAATVVPAVALRSVVGGDGEVALCGTDRVAHVRKVHAGVARNGLADIRGEVTPSDRVVVEPVLGVADGDRIEARQ